MTHLASRLRTGLADIDAEHERLFSLLDRAGRLCTRPGVPECQTCASHKREACRYIMLDVLDDLIGDALEHFAHEELECSGVLSAEQFESHRRAHRELLSRLRLTFAAFQSGDNFLPTQIEAICREWLERHLIEFDLPLYESRHAAATDSALLCSRISPWSAAFQA